MAFIRSLRHAALIVLGIMAASACSALASPVLDEQPTRERQLTVCEMISREAHRDKLPEWFFARLIWQESAFNPKAVSPQGAQGIAQFMPDTARALGLANPFAPMEALQASARLLTEHLVNFGNLGLAAAAYNAGENRVQNWLSGHSALPFETIDYVLFVTGRPVFEWSEPATRHTVPPKGKEIVTDCAVLAEQGAEPRQRNAGLSSAGIPN